MVMVRIVSADELLVPEGSHVLHIGPHKTGTTSLQSALFNSRDALAEQGVRFVGYNRHPISAILAITGRRSPFTDSGRPPGMDRWDEVLGAMRSAEEPRTVLSSEFFADADDEGIQRVVDAVGADRIQVVVTLRPLAKIIPSQWQQFIQSGRIDPLDEWLHRVFEDPGAEPTFWRRHRHDRLIERWAAVVGPERVRVVVVDDSDHSSILRSFESLLGLTPGTLVVDRSKSNRSLTLGEVEAVRLFNTAFWNARLGMALHTKVMRSGAAHFLQERRPEKDERKILLPQWALDAAEPVSRAIIDGVRATDVLLAGDLELLTAQPHSREEVGETEPVTADPVVAARLAMGVLLGTDAATGADPAAAVTTVAPGEDPRAAALEAARQELRREAQARAAAAEEAQRERAAQAAAYARIPRPRRFAARALRAAARRARGLARRFDGR